MNFVVTQVHEEGSLFWPSVVKLNTEFWQGRYTAHKGRIYTVDDTIRYNTPIKCTIVVSLKDSKKL